MRKAVAIALCLAIFAIPLSGCFSLRHNVGSGSQGGTQVSEKQWYLLWGLVPLNNVNSQTMAGGANNYTVDSGVSVVDFVINFFTQYVTIYCQTVTVTK